MTEKQPTEEEVVSALVSILNHNRWSDTPAPTPRAIAVAKVWIVQAAMDGLDVTMWLRKLEKLDGGK